MALTLLRSRKPWEGLTTFFDDFDSLFDRQMQRPVLESSWTPSVDIEEKDGKYVLKADLPGIKKKDIHIELNDGYLTLKGVRQSENEEKKGNFYRMERSYGSFERVFRIPDNVTEKDIKAKYNDGVLELTMPSARTEKPKAIEIKVE